MSRRRRSEPRKVGATSPEDQTVTLPVPLTVAEARVLAAGVDFLPGPPTVSRALRAHGETGRRKLNAAVQKARASEPERNLEHQVRDDVANAEARRA